MKVKFVEKRTRAGGRTVWVVNPPPYIRDSLKAEYQQFDLLEEANSYASEIDEAYRDYKRGVIREFKAAEATVDGLISYYKSTNDYLKLADNSKRLYLAMLKDAQGLTLASSNVHFGGMKSSNVTAEHADKLYLKLKELKSQHRATHVCKVLRKVWFSGLRAGKVRANPFQKMNLEGLKDRVVLWEPSQVQLFIETADALGTQSIGTMALLCYDLCQRPGDMRQLTWGNLREDVLVFSQEKTGTEVVIPASPRLMERLRTIRPSNVLPTDHIVLCEATGKPYDRRLYAKWAVRVRNEAKLPNTLQLRDLRRTGATEMAEAGCTEDELRSVTGHQSRDVLSIYVRPTIRLAAAGINKRFAQQ